MWGLVSNVVMLLSGAAAALTIGEKLGARRERRKLKREIKRATVTPEEALRAFRKQYPRTRTKIGRQVDGSVVLVVRRGDAAPVGSYLGYQVIRAPEHWD